MFIVKGGIYTDTKFETLEPGTEENYGPFETREEAVSTWRSKMGWMIDTCCHRLFVLPAAASSKA
jgi:hypothetical protein